MTKADLIDVICRETGLQRRDATAAVEAILEVLKEALQQGEPAHIRRFGTFTILNKSQRVGRNLQTGETMIISPRKAVTFKPSMVLRALVNRREIS